VVGWRCDHAFQNVEGHLDHRIECPVCTNLEPIPRHIGCYLKHRPSQRETGTVVTFYWSSADGSVGPLSHTLA
jgi:hypothetical protein